MQRNSERQTVCLNMIVKNESAVIKRCLESVLPFVDYWVIVDTGSTDGTQALIQETARSLKPGELHERPWRDFGFNRTEAFRLAQEKADYLLFIDADEVFSAPSGWTWPRLEHTAYYLSARYDSLIYARCLLVATRCEWRWTGVLHEYLESPDDHMRGTIDGPLVEVNHDGARAADPLTYAKDAKVLTDALKKEPDNTRYAFYLGQSLRDAGWLDQAVKAYKKRIAMRGFEEEVWYSQYQLGLLYERLKRPLGDILESHLKAFHMRPWRVEPMFHLARVHRERGLFAAGLMFAREAVRIPLPRDLLFLEYRLYEWLSHDERSVCAYQMAHYEEAVAAAEEALKATTIPPDHRARIERNRALAIKGLADRKAQASGWCLLRISPPNYVHGQAFDEVCEAISGAFKELGIDLPLVSNIPEVNGRPIVIGAHLIDDAMAQLLPANAVLYNFEQVNTEQGWMSPTYLSLMQRHTVWDYSEQNLTALRERGIAHGQLCPLGYVDSLTRIEAAPKEDIDVLLYGSPSPRRDQIVERLRAAGLTVHHLFGVYGAERDAWIARSKIVLNVHYYASSVFEVVRIAYLLANKRFVISEDCVPDDNSEAYESGMVMANYESLVTLCKQYAKDTKGRREVAERGYALARGRRMADFIRPLVAQAAVSTS